MKIKLLKYCNYYISIIKVYNKTILCGKWKNFGRTMNSCRTIEMEKMVCLARHKLCSQLIPLKLSINNYLRKMLLIKINIHKFIVNYIILFSIINVTCQFAPV